jgi:hypothetical protein
LIDWVPVAVVQADSIGHVSMMDPEPPVPTALYRLVYPARQAFQP